jgi:hypothetical protein
MRLVANTAATPNIIATPVRAVRKRRASRFLNARLCSERKIGYLGEPVY